MQANSHQESFAKNPPKNLVSVDWLTICCLVPLAIFYHSLRDVAVTDEVVFLSELTKTYAPCLSRLADQSSLTCYTYNYKTYGYWVFRVSSEGCWNLDTCFGAHDQGHWTNWQFFACQDLHWDQLGFLWLWSEWKICDIYFYSRVYLMKEQSVPNVFSLTMYN